MRETFIETAVILGTAMATGGLIYGLTAETSGIEPPGSPLPQRILFLSVSAIALLICARLGPHWWRQWRRWRRRR